MSLTYPYWHCNLYINYHILNELIQKHQQLSSFFIGQSDNNMYNACDLSSDSNIYGHFFIGIKSIQNCFMWASKCPWEDMTLRDHRTNWGWTWSTCSRSAVNRVTRSLALYRRSGGSRKSPTNCWILGTGQLKKWTARTKVRLTGSWWT